MTPAARALQLAVAALGLAGVVFGVRQAVGPYAEISAYRHASPCVGTPAPDCVRTVDAVVLSKRIVVTTHQDPPTPYQPPPAPPAPPMGPFHVAPPLAVHLPLRADTTTTSYLVKVRTTEARTEELDVSKSFYEAAKKNDHVAVSYWKHHVVRAALGEHTQEYPPGDWLTGSWTILWAGLLIFLSAATFGRVPLFAGWMTFIGGWILFSLLDVWRSSLIVLPVLTTIAYTVAAFTLRPRRW
ncbi:hypothetical protein BTM25_02030 [Actinomadura rubteroloni]|uniref:Uncharacterized protein n=1 Tax=Actinomadura rubteroloni TaxID=1926885 RepID=A0A2P4UL94_9ACTN|nr:YgjV family protein [Actinomadura rubteroloni]POM25820.1 hypothetical protein BTM25_02030 [Actinomadura rubteroloni]